VTVAILIGAGAPTSACAQAQLAEWLNPEIGKSIGRGDYRYTLFPDASVRGQGTDLGFQQHNVALSVPVYQDAGNELTLFARSRFQDFDTRAVFPTSLRLFPDELWDIRLGAAYRHKFDNGWIAGGSLTFGSASDRPFASGDDLLVQFIGLLRVPSRERDAWLFTLIYDNDNEFLGGVPVPGVAYHWVPSPTFNAVIGVPFTAIAWKPVAPLTIDALYAPLRRVRGRATWEIARPLRAYVDFDWDTERYLLTNRSNRDERLMYDEKRLTAGVRFDLRYVGVEVYGGYLFDRFYFLGEDYGDRNRDRFDVKSGPFVGIRLSVRWGPVPGP